MQPSSRIGIRLAGEIQVPALLYVQFYNDSTIPNFIRDASQPYGGVQPYTHEASRMLCATWHLYFTFCRFVNSEERLYVLESWRPKTMVGPRTAKVYPLYDGLRPVDFHFLENYHYRQLEEPDEVPHEDAPVWWPNVVVRLSEVYRSVIQLDMLDEGGAKKFFGFFARPYVRMQEYWILLDDKAFDMPLDKDLVAEDGQIDFLYWNSPDDAMRGKLRRGLEDCVSYDTLKRNLQDIVPVSDIDQLSRLQKYRLRIIAAYLRAWGDNAPVKPRLVRYGVADEVRRGTPPALVDVVDEIDRLDPHQRIGLRTVPAIELR
ncbi:uncharacterized protein F4812DRAFT_437803 [Daldinia caldariorum]|uniref:uncharacterized protein n=1 Tax=Daldinia caldariorum TaxID=326644 RepID=UPI002007FF20|nr:uncharacterized protein F4812DRAFT_437803 [Daldinia caldariorum]KAI1465851.1 hypothetical protein F4812DRAFT_437803 [Daldinia caldariorum]